MPQLALGCPHCKAEKIGFAPRGAVGVKPSTQLTLLFLQCEGCGHGVTAEIGAFPASVTQWMQGARPDLGAVLRTYPLVAAIKAPADVPPNVTASFLSGLDNLGRKGGANAAGAMFR